MRRALNKVLLKLPQWMTRSAPSRLFRAASARVVVEFAVVIVPPRPDAGLRGPVQQFQATRHGHGDAGGRLVRGRHMDQLHAAQAARPRHGKALAIDGQRHHARRKDGRSAPHSHSQDPRSAPCRAASAGSGRTGPGRRGCRTAPRPARHRRRCRAPPQVARDLFAQRGQPCGSSRVSWAGVSCRALTASPCSRPPWETARRRRCARRMAVRRTAWSAGVTGCSCGSGRAGRPAARRAGASAALPVLSWHPRLRTPRSLLAVPCGRSYLE